MSKVTELENALTSLFRKGTEVGYTETEIDEFLENIDYHALLQAVWNKAETVYAYRADGKNALSLDYRSSELFKQRATLLYDCCPDTICGYENSDRLTKVNWRRFHRAVSHITITPDGAVRLTFLDDEMKGKDE